MSKELMEKRNDLITRAEEILNTAKGETRELTEGEANEIEKIRADVSKIDTTTQAEESIRALSKMSKKEDDTPKEESKEMTAEEQKRAIEDQEEKTFENFLRGTVIHERAGEMTKAANGAVIPTTIANRILKHVYNVCPILARSDRYNVKGNLELPFYAETAQAKINVAYATEFTALTSNIGATDKVELTGFLAGALTKISRSLINNAQFNIVDFVVKEMGDAIARFIEGELLHGTANKVAGLSTLSNSVTAAAAAAVTADEVIKLHDSILDAYQQNAIWVMSPATRTALRLLKDGEDRYLLNDDISTPFGVSLLGKPVFVSDNMPDMATGKTAIFYGDMKGLACKFSEEINIEVLREKYADEHAVGVIGWFEFDAKVQDEQKIAKLVMA